MIYRHGVNKITIINRNNYNNNVCRACLAFTGLAFSCPAISCLQFRPFVSRTAFSVNPFCLVRVGQWRASLSIQKTTENQSVANIKLPTINAIRQRILFILPCSGAGTSFEQVCKFRKDTILFCPCWYTLVNVHFNCNDDNCKCVKFKS